MLLLLFILWGFAMTALVCIYVLKHTRSCLARATALAVLLIVLACGIVLLF